MVIFQGWYGSYHDETHLLRFQCVDWVIELLAIYNTLWAVIMQSPWCMVHKCNSIRTRLNSIHGLTLGAALIASVATVVGTWISSLTVYHRRPHEPSNLTLPDLNNNEPLVNDFSAAASIQLHTFVSDQQLIIKAYVVPFSADTFHIRYLFTNWLVGKWLTHIHD